MKKKNQFLDSQLTIELRKCVHRKKTEKNERLSFVVDIFLADICFYTFSFKLHFFSSLSKGNLFFLVLFENVDAIRGSEEFIFQKL